MTAASNSEARKRAAEQSSDHVHHWDPAVERLIEQARAEGAAEVVARVEAIAHSAKANTYRDEACRGVVQLPYASNRYVRLLDDIRAALRGDA